jgi:hypothetical protein
MPFGARKAQATKVSFEGTEVELLNTSTGDVELDERAG